MCFYIFLTLRNTVEKAFKMRAKEQERAENLSFIASRITVHVAHVLIIKRYYIAN